MKYQNKNHKQIKIILIFTMIISVISAGLLFYLHIDYVNKLPLVSYPLYKLSENNWTSNPVIIEVINDTKNISEYSFDGGKNFQLENKYSVSENSNINIVIKDINGRLSKNVQLVIRNIDKSAPEISFTNPITIQTGTNYNLRSGVVVKDTESGLNNNYVVTPSTIDTSKTGTYTITYTAFDKVGNHAEKQRTIIVSDSEAHTYYRSRSIKYENYSCDPYLCNCVKSNDAQNTKQCPTGYTFSEPNNCCGTCNKTCKRTVYGNWSEWQKEKITASNSLEVETKIE